MLQFSGLSGECNISHFITTRHGGVSQGNYSTMNPVAVSGAHPRAFARKDFCAVAGA